MYLRLVSMDRQVYVTFVAGNLKVALSCATTIPRLDLCAETEASTEVAKIKSELRNMSTQTHMYPDSEIVLGYLYNEQRRFSKYIAMCQFHSQPCA